MSSISTQVSQGGRVVIPASIRQKMNIKTGDKVLLTWDDNLGELRLSTRKQRLIHARELIKNYAKQEGSVVDDLIEERRKSASHE